MQVPSSSAAAGTRLVYAGVAGGIADGHLYLADPDGSHVVDLSKGWPGRFQASNPTLSPNGRRIAFVMRDFKRTGSSIDEIYTMPARPTPVSETRRLTKNGVDDDDPAWSPNGRKLVFTREMVNRRHFGSSEVYRMRRDGSHVTRLTFQWAYNLTPAYSPDGSKVAYASTVDGLGCSSGGSRSDFVQIEVMPSGGGKPTNVTHQSRLTAVAPDWSPDGRRLAYNGYEYDGSCNLVPVNHVYVNTLDGTAGAQIAEGAAPRWSPDGTRLAAVTANPYDRIFTIDPDGTHEVDLDLTGFIGDWGVPAA
ncbi:MAG: TolB protein [Nocardioidaceae bacterium]|nr:TolB protein [Nocardioidaceae bacterium]